MKSVTRLRQPHIDLGFDINDGVREVPKPEIKPQQIGTGYVWNGATCELLPILWPGHPDYRANTAMLLAAFRRWDKSR